MSNFQFKAGDRVKIIGKHPRNGQLGTFEKLEYIKVLRTIQPKISLDDGFSCFAKPEELERLLIVGNRETKND